MPTGLQKIYSKIPGSYEIINHIITFGADIITRRSAAKIAVADGGALWMDICSGTGELAQNINRLKTDGTTVIGADFSLPMVQIAKSKPDLRNVPYTICLAEELPFADNSFDLVTLSFATRNLNTSKDMLIRRLSEICRILKPGGRFVNLETSQPKNKMMKKLIHGYISLSVKQIGHFVSGNKEGYAYLANSIPRFYDAKTLSEILIQSGFSKVTYNRKFFGAMAIHKAVK